MFEQKKESFVRLQRLKENRSACCEQVIQLNAMYELCNILWFRNVEL